MAQNAILDKTTAVIREISIVDTNIKGENQTRHLYRDTEEAKRDGEKVGSEDKKVTNNLLLTTSIGNDPTCDHVIERCNKQIAACKRAIEVLEKLKAEAARQKFEFEQEHLASIAQNLDPTQKAKLLAMLQGDN